MTNNVLRTCRGDQLCFEDQKKVLAQFVNRYTLENVPRWAKATRVDGSNYPVQFASDAEWLRNTHFKVRLDGRLHAQSTYCYSRPTWPFNPELRKGYTATHDFTAH
jgi:hypothetical protein